MCVWVTSVYTLDKVNYSTIDVVYFVGHPNCDGTVYSGKSIRTRCDGSSDRFFMVDILRHFSFHPVLHNWCNMLSCLWDGAHKRTLAA